MIEIYGTNGTITVFRLQRSSFLSLSSSLSRSLCLSACECDHFILSAHGVWGILAHCVVSLVIVTETLFWIASCSISALTDGVFFSVIPHKQAHTRQPYVWISQSFPHFIYLELLLGDFLTGLGLLFCLFS